MAGGRSGNCYKHAAKGAAMEAAASCDAARQLHEGPSGASKRLTLMVVPLGRLEIAPVRPRRCVERKVDGRALCAAVVMSRSGGAGGVRVA